MVNVTEGLPGSAGPEPAVTGAMPPEVAGVWAPGAAGGGRPGVTDGGSVVVVVFGCFAEAGAGCLSRIVLPTPVCRVAMMDSDSEVIMNRIAEPVVAFESSVADPRGPNAVCEPIPPNAPARSAAFPLCNRTTTIRNRQTKTCTIVNNV